MKLILLIPCMFLIQCVPGNVEEVSGQPDSLVVYSIRDVHVDRENKNTGLGSEVRLYYSDAVALIAFGALPAIPGGRKLVKAELTVRGWSDAKGQADVTLDLFETSDAWEEGTGHWYAHSGTTQNGYDKAYALFPEYEPPAGTTNPVSGGGIVWNGSEELRQGLVKITTAKAVLPEGYPVGCYPLLEHTGAVVFDLTEYLEKHGSPGKPLSVGIRQATGEDAINEGFSWLYSRNHFEPKVYGPRLVLTFQ